MKPAGIGLIFTYYKHQINQISVLYNPSFEKTKSMKTDKGVIYLQTILTGS